LRPPPDLSPGLLGASKIELNVLVVADNRGDVPHVANIGIDVCGDLVNQLAGVGLGVLAHCPGRKVIGDKLDHEDSDEDEREEGKGDGSLNAAKARRGPPALPVIDSKQRSSHGTESGKAPSLS